MHIITTILVVSIASGLGHGLLENLPVDLNSFNLGLANVGYQDGVPENSEEFTTVFPAGFMGSTVDVKVIGTLSNTAFTNRTVYNFRGMHFGQDPSGEKRFKKVSMYSLPPGQDTLNATRFGSKCMQTSVDLMVDPWSAEDCLTLNVYTNEKPSGETTGTLPVMVFIHGGSFIRGSARPYNPDFLLENEVILVTIQYRLGAFGFFTQLDRETPGNAGLWDQILALQWVQENIGYFGGDKTDVTIFGQDAGAVSVNLLLLFKSIPGGPEDPMFTAAIMEGGTALDYVALDPNPAESALGIALACGCQEPDITSCMKEKDASRITFQTGLYIVAMNQIGQLGISGMLPVVQDEPAAIDPQDVLLRESPSKLMQSSKNVIDVPVIIGANKHEGTYYYGMIYWSLLKDKYKNESYLRDQLLPDILGTVGVADQSYNFVEIIQRDYFDGRDLANLTDSAPGMIDFTGTFYIKNSAWRLAKTLKHLYMRESEIYFYSFDFSSKDSLFHDYFWPQTPSPPFEHGVCHGDELIYLFNLKDITEFTDYQILMAARMTTLWTNFAIYKNPTPKNNSDFWQDDLGMLPWHYYSLNDLEYMHLSKACWTKYDYRHNSYHVALDDDPRPTPSPTPTPTPGPSNYDYYLAKEMRNKFLTFMIISIFFAVGIFFAKFDILIALCIKPSRLSTSEPSHGSTSEPAHGSTSEPTHGSTSEPTHGSTSEATHESTTYL